MHERVRAALDASAAVYVERFHKDVPAVVRCPGDFAEALGRELGSITKTILLRVVGGDAFCLVVLSCDRRMDMDKVAAAAGVKRVQMAGRQELDLALGYPPTGVSPIGAGDIPVLMDEALMRHPTVLVGSGEVAAEIEMRPEDLKEITGAFVLPLSV